MGTINYGFYTEDNSATKFKEWRKKINGSDGSNIVMIDNILGEKGDKSTHVTCTLLASAWAGLDAPFTQEILVTGLEALQNGNVSVAQNATFEQRMAAREAMLAVTGQETGKLVISADGEMPDIDIPVVIILLG